MLWQLCQVNGSNTSMCRRIELLIKMAGICGSLSYGKNIVENMEVLKLCHNLRQHTGWITTWLCILPSSVLSMVFFLIGICVVRIFLWFVSPLAYINVLLILVSGLST